MEKKKILIIAPYGMTLRQLILNNTFWGYLVMNYEIHMKTPIEISNALELGIGRVIQTRSSGLIKKILARLFFHLLALFKNYSLVDFYISNNLGEHLVFRLNNVIQAKTMFWKYLVMCLLAPVKNLLYSLLKSLSVVLSEVRNSKYEFILITHISESYSELEALSANRLNIPVITLTLGMDNYRHGPLIYTPDLMLLWGREHEFEFKNWHQEKYMSMSAVKCEIVGNLVHDAYLQNVGCEIVNGFIDGGNNVQYDGYILVPAMIEAVIPGQTRLVQSLIEYLKDRSLNMLIIVRVLPGTDIEMWENFESENEGLVLIQEPQGGSYDKRGKRNNFKLEQELLEVKLFAELLSNAKLVVNLYPTTVILDAYLFDTPCILPLFDWRDQKCLAEHPYSKVVFAKMFSHPLNSQYNMVLNWSSLYKALDDVLLDEKIDHYIGRGLYDYVCHKSRDGSVGLRACDAIENFLAKSRLLYSYA